jgi:hypothetical protein
MDLNWSRRKQSWPNLKYHNWIYMKRLRKTMKNLSVSWLMFKSWTYQYKSEVLQLELVPVLMKSNQRMLWNQVQKIGRVGMQNSWDSLNSLHFFSLATKTPTFPTITSLIVPSCTIIKLQCSMNDTRIPCASCYEDNSGSKRNCQ